VHAEYDPAARDALIQLSSCPVPEAGGPRLHDKLKVTLDEGSLARRICGRAVIEEEFYCSYELNPAFAPAFERSALRITGRGESGEARIVELAGSGFFVATLFLPQLRPAGEGPHPLIRAFVECAVNEH
jgi:CTP synthase (UTP-ammonia lyase)